MTESDSNMADDVQMEPWVEIQKTTFTNWVNDKLRREGVEICDCRYDFRDGVALCKLMVSLKGGRRLGRIIQKKNLNHYEASGNLALALDSMAQDGVRLVNIGSEDIAAGNLKLILGMIWLLIRHYQIGSKTKLPAKQMMRFWINAVLYPHIEISNFSTDWNDGVALHGIIEYCAPGTYPNWFHGYHDNRVEHCSEAMEKAKELFSIPLVVEPENFASPNLDELSCMTYMSYYMSIGGPGYNATLEWVRSKIAPLTCDNFQGDWNDGHVITALVSALGKPVLSGSETDKPDVTCRKAMDKSEKEFGVPSIISARYMTQKDLDHIAVMAYAEWHRAMTEEPETSPQTLPLVMPLVTPEEESEHDTEVESEPELEVESEEEEESEEELKDEENRDVEPDEDGEPEHQEIASPGDDLAAVLDDQRSDVKVTMYDKWRIYGPLTIQIKVEEGEDAADISAHARSPNGTEHPLSVSRTDERDYQTTITPDEKGTWNVVVERNGQRVVGSPFRLHVYDPSYAEIVRHYSGAVPVNEPYSFTVQTKETGSDALRVHIQHENEAVETVVTPSGDRIFKVAFTPNHAGLYDCSVYLGGQEVSGSPFSVKAEVVRVVSAHGEGLSAGTQGLPSHFTVDTRPYPGKQLVIDVTGPSGIDADVQIDDSDPIVQVTFTPEDVGIYQIDTIYDNVPVRGSPFRAVISTGNVNTSGGNVKVYDIPTEVKRNREYSFVVDAKDVGKGRIEIDSDLPVLKYDRLSEKCYRVSFVPKKTGLHDMTVKYNDKVVGEPIYSIMVTEE